MELVVGTTPETRAGTESFLTGFNLMALDKNVAECSVIICQSKRIKLPDAIVWATAQVNNCILVTRNTKDMPANEPSVRMPYIIQ